VSKGADTLSQGDGTAIYNSSLILGYQKIMIEGGLTRESERAITASSEPTDACCRSLADLQLCRRAPALLAQLLRCCAKT
jgi:hypothetical protein